MVLFKSIYFILLVMNGKKIEIPAIYYKDFQFCFDWGSLNKSKENLIDTVYRVCLLMIAFYYLLLVQTQSISLAISNTVMNVQVST